ncbi:hypothetical protein AN639_05070 [Candidatus Epulonipiscium fishelsonii]|nr:hypothetical protein AN639_05070 [Epulopiscium sp. SCG-B05WGA-EpuloA1]
MEEADKDFHPRFNVKVKTYKYQILNQEYNDPFIRDFVWFYPCRIDLEKMKQASQFLLGNMTLKDFVQQEHLLRRQEGLYISWIYIIKKKH